MFKDPLISPLWLHIAVSLGTFNIEFIRSTLFTSFRGIPWALGRIKEH